LSQRESSGRSPVMTVRRRSNQWVNVAAAERRDREARDATREARLRRNVEIFAVVWFCAVVVVDLVIPGSVIVIGLVTLSTLLVSAVSSLGRTIAFGVAAVVVTALSPLWDTLTTSAAIVRVVNTFLVGVVAVVIALLRLRRERHLTSVVAAAEAAQLAVLPTLPRQTGHVNVAARYHSAADEAMLGGDVFDMYWDEDGTVIALVGDVCGKGLASVQEGARLIRAFRQYASTSPSLDRLAARMDAYMRPFLAPEVFVTAVLVDASSPDYVEVASCGHPAPVLLTDHRMTPVEIAYGPPLGLGFPTETRRHSWQQGDRILMCTDGLLEARDRTGRFFPLDRLEPALRSPSLEAALEETIQQVEGFVPRRRLTDDVCLMLLENRGP
jgi:phosphoserine phosphatase RsbU/P